ncbi:MAG: redoxin domain-containing protein [Polyangiaceae bacterium]|jgi:mycoredoxin-dependent peroxiredoxin
MAIAIGSDAPDFELPSSELDNGRPGKKIRLSDYRGKKNVVLAFYPLDFSPVCSSEHTCFVEDFSELEKVDAQVLGISVDSAWAHLAFAKQMHIKYPLLADFQPRGEVATKYGLYLADKGITSRATVIIGKNGKVAWVKEEQIPQARDNKKIIEELRKLG